MKILVNIALIVYHTVFMYHCTRIYLIISLYFPEIKPTDIFFTLCLLFQRYHPELIFHQFKLCINCVYIRQLHMLVLYVSISAIRAQKCILLQ